MAPYECWEEWIPGSARSLSSGAHSRDPLGLLRMTTVACGALDRNATAGDSVAEMPLLNF